MAIVKPFAALRPRPELAAQICELPYDVMSSDEARALAEGNPLSFLRVSKPEIDLPPGTGLYDAAVYKKGRDHFQRLISQGALQQDAKPYFYIYRQIMGEHAQTGLVAVTSCEEYLRNVIRKHEFTRPDKEDDRVRHIETLDSQTGPVFLSYRANAALDGFITIKTSTPPEIDFTAPDGVRHSSWTIHSEEDIRFVQEEFAPMEALYIADGHHRSAAAGRVFQSRAGGGNSAWFLSVLFPDNQVKILPYNRVLKDLNGLEPATLLAKIEKAFTIQPEGPSSPQRKHEISLFLNGTWHSLHFRPELTATHDPVENLDVTLLQKHVLAPVFGIDDPRTSQRISFVGGIRGTSELEKLVQSGEFACAFSMFPTSIQDLMTIADAGGIMPPKSTWFEPKLRDGMFCHMLVGNSRALPDPVQGKG